MLCVFYSQQGVLLYRQAEWRDKMKDHKGTTLPRRRREGLVSKSEDQDIFSMSPVTHMYSQVHTVMADITSLWSHDSMMMLVRATVHHDYVYPPLTSNTSCSVPRSNSWFCLWRSSANFLSLSKTRCQLSFNVLQAAQSMHTQNHTSDALQFVSSPNNINNDRSFDNNPLRLPYSNINS